MSSFRPNWLTILYYSFGMPVLLIGIISLYFSLGKVLTSLFGESVGEIIGPFLSLGFYFFLIFLLIILSSTGRWIRKKEQEFIQKKRDLKAKRLYNRLILSTVESKKDGDQQETYYLYLRPFTSTGKINIITRHKVTYPHKLVSKSQTPIHKIHWDDLETLISRIVEPIGPLIAIGKPGEQIGASRLLSSKNKWKEDFLFLAERAKALFVLPSRNKGTFWEINRIIQSKIILSKTIFIIPPNPIDISSIIKDKLDVIAGYGVKSDTNDCLFDLNIGASSSKLRANAIKTMIHLGFNLPDDDGLGLLLLLGPEAKIVAYRYIEPMESKSIFIKILRDIWEWYSGSDAYRLNIRNLRKNIREIETIMPKGN